jgi:hypothetical protein
LQENCSFHHYYLGWYLVIFSIHSFYPPHQIMLFSHTHNGLFSRAHSHSTLSAHFFFPSFPLLFPSLSHSFLADYTHIQFTGVDGLTRGEYSLVNNHPNSQKIYVEKWPSDVAPCDPDHSSLLPLSRYFIRDREVNTLPLSISSPLLPLFSLTSLIFFVFICLFYITRVVLFGVQIIVKIVRCRR